MDARQRWKALQWNLEQARTASAAGNLIRALQAVDAALDLDPQYLAAQSLRNQLLARSEWPSQPFVTSDEEVTPQPQVPTHAYAQFEERAKVRRVQRRLEAARTAIAASQFDEATAAVEELRELEPDLADLPILAGAIERGRSKQRRSGARAGWAVAAVLFIIAILSVSALRERRVSPPPVVPIATATPIPEPQPVATAAVPIAGAAAVSVPPVAPDPPSPPPSPENRVQVADVPRPSATITAVERRPAGGEIAGFTTPAVRSTPAPEATPIPAVTPPAPAAASPIASSATTTPVATPAIVPSSTSMAVNDEQLVQDALQRYRWAYGQLDAASAHAVWPGVDQAALAKAFDGLASQALTFDNCAVQVAEAAATASCSGTTRYVPKVGSREPRTEPRRWNFSLRKRGADWQIENARAER